VLRTVAALRTALAEARAGGRLIALVPTMGALHEGHRALIARAGDDGHMVVVSIFVNPTQFGPGEDLAAYPRDEARDLDVVADAGAELVFAPGVEEVYPDGFATTVHVGGPSERLEGAARPGHFDGVATVVAKLLLAVRPDRAVFGQKDAQQVAVIRRLVRDLHLDDLDLVVAPTVRAADGLALSSRNAYLGPDERRAAAVLWRALSAASELAAAGERDAARLIAAAEAELATEPACAPEYVAVVDADGFRPLARVGAAPALICVAARVGPARLIDNVPLPPPHPTTDRPRRSPTQG
jgi:pantoate--beta-alanine ligase